MNKKLLALPMLLMVLGACGGDEGAKPFTVDITTFATPFGELTATDTYVNKGADSTVTVTAGGVEWSFSGNKMFGRPTTQYSAGLNNLNLIQIKKGALMANSSPLAGYKTVTVLGYSTYADAVEANLPSVSVGTSTEQYTVVRSNEAIDQLPESTSKMTFETTEFVDYAAATPETTKPIYTYTLNFAIPEGSTYFQIGAGTGGASYVKSFVFGI